MIKRLISMMLAGMLLVIPFCAKALESVFPDVPSPQYDWAINEINEMTQIGIIKGYTDMTFRPEQGVKKIEALILAARVLGYTNEANKSFILFAESMYEDALAKYNIQYKSEVAYLLYKDILTEAELPLYIGNQNADDTLKRYEAAILLTKMMGKEDEVKNSIGVLLDYTDASQIPASAKPYVEYVTNEGLMKAMEVGENVNNFVPNYPVTRAQISVLLYRIMKKLNLEIKTGIILAVNENSVRIKERESSATYRIMPDTIIKVDGYSAELSDMLVGTEIALTFRDNTIYSAESISTIVDEQFKGTITAISGTSTQKSITVKSLETGETRKFSFADEFVVTYNGAAASINSISVGDFATLEITNGKITALRAEQKDVSVEGVVENIELDPDVVITLKSSNGELTEYKVSDSVSVKRNGKEGILRDVLVGDSVKATVRYGEIISIVATSKTKNTEGTIAEINIATMPSITIKNAQGQTKYNVSMDCVYEIDGKEGTIYDLRLGSSIQVTLEGNTITKIVSKRPTQTLQYTGVIKRIKQGHYMLTLSVVDASGNETEVDIFGKLSTTGKLQTKVIDSTDGSKEIDFSKLQVGYTVVCVGEHDVDFFEATTIMVIKK